MTIDREVLALVSTVLVALIAGGASLAVAIVQLFGKLREIGADAAASRAQVENSHRTNLRDDVDELRNEMLAELRAIRHAASREHAALWQAATGHKPPTGRIPLPPLSKDDTQ